MLQSIPKRSPEYYCYLHVVSRVVHASVCVVLEALAFPYLSSGTPRALLTGSNAEGVMTSCRILTRGLVTFLPQAVLSCRFLKVESDLSQLFPGKLRTRFHSYVCTQTCIPRRPGNDRASCTLQVNIDD